MSSAWVLQIFEKRAEYINLFRVAGATSAARAVPLHELQTGPSAVFNNMIHSGILVACSGERFYLDEQALEACEHRQTRNVVLDFSLFLLLVLALLIVFI